MARILADPRGRVWTVWRVYPTNARLLPEEMYGGWLCFESQTGEKRRVSDFPADWETHDDADLWALYGDLPEAAPRDHVPPPAETHLAEPPAGASE